MNHVNNLNDILADELNESIRGRRWLKLQRSDERSKSAHLPIQNRQTVNCESNNSIDKRKMGQTQSTSELTDSEINQISSKLKSNLKLANQTGQILLVANNLDDELLHKNY